MKLYQSLLILFSVTIFIIDTLFFKSRGQKNFTYLYFKLILALTIQRAQLISKQMIFWLVQCIDCNGVTFYWIIYETVYPNLIQFSQGYLPEMSLHVDGPSRKPGEQLKEKQDMIWDKEISESKARRILQKKFYPFQEVS